jgi:DNA adenine methylase
MRKPRSAIEVYNDLDGDLVNVFRVLRDPETSAELQRQLVLTPYARDEFRDAHKPATDAIERARRAIVRCVQGFGSAGHGRSDTNGFRLSFLYSTDPAAWWVAYPAQVQAWCARLAGVVIENREWQKVIESVDAADALIYADPPYPVSTRSSLKSTNRRLYNHEMTDEDHRELAARLRSAKGAVVLSGYPCDLYDRELYPDWERHTTEARADRNAPRTEVVWLNAACSRALREQQQQRGLFTDVA